MARKTLEPAPWPIIAGLALLAAGAAWAALHTSYDAAAAFAWLTAAGAAYTTAHMTAEHILDRITRRAERTTR